VRVLGLDPHRDRRRLLPRIGVVLQHGGAWTGARAEEMLRHAASLHAHPLPVPMLVERLGLGSCGRTAYRRLSGGQQQRLALAMALVGRPELLFVDEPTAGMDPQARRDTWELLREVRSDGVTTVLTTHYLDEAERLADQVHIIERGRVIASGTPDELTRASGQRTLRLVASHPLPDHLPDSLAAELGSLGEVHWVDTTTLLVTGELEAKALVTVTQWCERHDVRLDSLNFGRHNLEDVFLRLTGREFDDR
jgi:ABC-2 type transport system ATP-binding protein